MPTAKPSVASESEAALLAHVRRCRHRLAWHALLRRLLLLLAAGALFLLFVVVADHAWPDGLPRGVVTTAARLWAVALAVALVFLTGLPLLRRLNPLFAARLLERASGIEHNSLVNALLLRDAPAGAYAYAAATTQAASDVRQHPPRRVAPPGAMRMPAAVGAAVLAAWVIYAIVSPKAIWPSLARFFGAEIAAPTATWLQQLRPGPSDIIHAGEPLEFEFSVGGQSAGQVLLDVLPPTASAPPLAHYELQPASGGPGDLWTLSLAPHEVVADIRFRVSANDATLTGFVPVHPLPAIAQTKIDLEPPAYTGWPAETVIQPDLEVLAGTNATFRIWANTPVHDAIFVVAGLRETRTRMTVSATDPQQLTLSMLLVESGDYHIEFTDRWGVPLRDPPAHRINVRPDLPPRVQVISPTQADTPGDIVDITRHLLLEVEAQDDVRLAELVLVRAQDGVEQTDTLVAESDDGGRILHATVRTADLGLDPGQYLRVWFRTRDDRALLDGRPAAHTARSRTLTLVRPPESERQRRLGRPTGKGEGGSEQPGESDQSQPGGEREATSQEATSQPAAGDSGDADTASDDFDEEIKRFIDEHGEMARDVGRQMGQPADRPDDAQGEDAAPEPGDEAQPSGGGQRQDVPEPPPDAGKEGDDQPADDTPEQGGAAGASTDEPEPDADDPGPGPDTDEPPIDSPDAPDAAPAVPTPPNAPTERKTTSDSEGLTETIDLLEMLSRGDELSEDMLVDMGWPAAKAAAFVKSLQRLHESARRGGRVDTLRRLRFDTTVGDEQVQQGGGVDGDLTATVDPVRTTADNIRRIAPPAEQQVPAHLRALLDAYYRALAEQQEQR